jgi:hypothetical protein
MTVALGALTPAVEEYASRVAEAIPGLEALYVLGSGATGDFEAHRSDLDLVAVVDHALGASEKEMIIGSLGRLDVPARTLELAVYAAGSQPPEFELNANADADGAAEFPDEPPHWFVIDAALAQERAVPLVGPPWSTYFEPISPAQARKAVSESLAWSEAHPDDEFARANAVRARHHLEHGEWLGKREAEGR